MLYMYIVSTWELETEHESVNRIDANLNVTIARGPDGVFTAIYVLLEGI